MKKGFLVRFFGWVLFIFSLCIVIAGLIANNGESFEFGIIGFFVVLGALGFFLTRYKKEKKPIQSKIEETPKKQRRKKTPEPTPELIEISRQKLGIPKGKIFHILYEDSSGNVTERDIEIQKVLQRGEKLYIHAFCHLRLAVRLFSVERIIDMTDNGQKVNIEEYLYRDFTPLSTENFDEYTDL